MNAHFEHIFNGSTVDVLDSVLFFLAMAVILSVLGVVFVAAV